MLSAWVAVLLYFLITIVIGWYSFRKQKTQIDHWTGGRELGAMDVGFSLSAGFMSVSWSCVYAVQLFYWYGIGAFWIITFPWLISLALIYRLSTKYRGLKAFSQPEMVGDKFGSKSRKVVALSLAIVFLVWGGAEIYVAANLLSAELNINITAVMILISVVIGIYLTFGGFRAVIATDKLQYVLVAIYIVVVAILAIKGLNKTPGFLPDTFITSTKTSVSWISIFSPGITIILLTLIAYLPGWIYEADLWLRVQAARDVTTAKKGVFIGALNGLIFVGIIPMFIGVAALELYPVTEGGYPQIIGFEGDAIFSALIQDYAPAWLRMLLSVGLVAAAMSTIDTCVNVMGLSIAYDYFHDKKQSTNVSFQKIITSLSVFAALLFALFIDSLWDIFYLSSGILSTAVAFPVASVFIKGVNSEGIFYSSVFGLTGTIIFYFLESRGLLIFIEPDWLIKSSVGFILWGFVSAAVGYIFGKLQSHSQNISYSE
ncbi:MAG: sodium:solute symporter family protein [Candidatus Marinimicrobia bacterium]|nr:sodium:solute symporter family protein [Candidatus Neomarinimicrobiota bacterium]MBT3634590.1 sodium:solute symporter family protein [Candidatus Neomarinimicrobiota bacterium]MBT3683329.1 sodium:solute symporter family protein [Candidatus Neomarinimicrobiota bacterium]MBT3760244.1 sodium:solute symporter family protein [Candidatus Neomarinimicrobiota bacterium]MBT3896339.1 sodium:solute symporter family protein [Candidatus Neomarinimicrobiota bacterium]